VSQPRRHRVRVDADDLPAEHPRELREPRAAHPLRRQLRPTPRRAARHVRECERRDRARDEPTAVRRRHPFVRRVQLGRLPHERSDRLRQRREPEHRTLREPDGIRDQSVHQLRDVPQRIPHGELHPVERLIEDIVLQPEVCDRPPVVDVVQRPRLHPIRAPDLERAGHQPPVLHPNALPLALDRPPPERRREVAIGPHDHPLRMLRDRPMHLRRRDTPRRSRRLDDLKRHLRRPVVLERRGEERETQQVDRLRGRRPVRDEPQRLLRRQPCPRERNERMKLIGRWRRRQERVVPSRHGDVDARRPSLRPRLERTRRVDPVQTSRSNHSRS
jgi:hypothetical protein